MEPYDFQAFLGRMAELDYLDIIREADAECGRVEAASSKVKGAVRQRKMGSLKYAAQIKAFLFYMRFGTRPGSASEAEFQSYRHVVEVLVEKGQFKPEALDAFR